MDNKTKRANKIKAKLAEHGIKQVLRLQFLLGLVQLIELYQLLISISPQRMQKQNYKTN